MCVHIHTLHKNRPLVEKYLLRAYCVKVFRVHSMDNTKIFEKHPEVSKTGQSMSCQEFYVSEAQWISTRAL